MATGKLGRKEDQSPKTRLTTIPVPSPSEPTAKFGGRNDDGSAKSHQSKRTWKLEFILNGNAKIQR